MLKDKHPEKGMHHAAPPEERPGKTAAGRPRKITEIRERAKVPTGAMIDMRRMALDGDEWAMRVLCTVAATDLRELGKNSDEFEVKDFFDIMSIVNPRKAVDAYAARLGAQMQPEEKLVVRAVERLAEKDAAALREKLEEIAGNSPYGEAREAARRRLNG